MKVRSSKASNMAMAGKSTLTAKSTKENGTTIKDTIKKPESRIPTVMFTKARSTLVKSQERDLSRQRTVRSTLEKLRTERDMAGVKSQTQQPEGGVRAAGLMATPATKMEISTRPT